MEINEIIVRALQNNRFQPSIFKQQARVCKADVQIFLP